MVNPASEQHSLSLDEQAITEMTAVLKRRPRQRRDVAVDLVDGPRQKAVSNGLREHPDSLRSIRSLSFVVHKAASATRFPVHASALSRDPLDRAASR